MMKNSDRSWAIAFLSDYLKNPREKLRLKVRQYNVLANFFTTEPWQNMFREILELTRLYNRIFTAKIVPKKKP